LGRASQQPTDFSRVANFFVILAVWFATGSCLSTLAHAQSRAAGAGANKYTADLQNALTKDDREAGIRIIRSAPPDIDGYFLLWLEDHAAEFPPEYFFPISQRFYARDKDAAIKWFVAGRTRLLYDLYRCTDTSVRDKVSIASASLQDTVLKTAMEDPQRTHALGKAALAWEASMPIHSQSPLKICMNGLKGYSLAMTKPSQRAPVSESEWVKPRETHSAVLNEARAINAKFVDSVLKAK
jgi:hypothetical protein